MGSLCGAEQVDSLGRCVPKVEYLQLGDTRINMADLVTSPDLKELGEEIEKGTDTKLEDAGKELTKELNENVDRLDVKTAAADKVNEDAIEKLEGYVNGAFKTKVNEDRKEAISGEVSTDAHPSESQAICSLPFCQIASSLAWARDKKMREPLRFLFLCVSYLCVCVCVFVSAALK